MMARSLLLPVSCAAAFALGELVSGCATQREQRISSAEARERPTDEACEPKGQPPKPGWIWACGYWHWDGVRYAWVEGEWRAP